MKKLLKLTIVAASLIAVIGCSNSVVTQTASPVDTKPKIQTLKVEKVNEGTNDEITRLYNEINPSYTEYPNGAVEILPGYTEYNEAALADLLDAIKEPRDVLLVLTMANAQLNTRTLFGEDKKLAEPDAGVWRVVDLSPFADERIYEKLGEVYLSYEGRTFVNAKDFAKDMENAAKYAAKAKGLHDRMALVKLHRITYDLVYNVFGDGTQGNHYKVTASEGYDVE